MNKCDILICFSFLLQVVFAQNLEGDICTVRTTGSPGKCKLFSECQSAVEDLKKYNRFPQTCSFQGRRAIVCCPDEVKAEEEQRKPGNISKRKCREYSAYAYKRMRSPVLLINASMITRDECGHKVQKLIVGGTEAARKEFPHMAAIGFEPTPGDIRWLCGGTILSKNYVLTAAHCLSNFLQGDALWVLLGTTTLTETRQRQQIKVAERIPHPQYKSSSHYHDIGLLKLERPAKMTPYSRPACLYLQPEVNTESAIATGWGITENGQGSNNLLKVTINLFDHANCNSTFKNQISRRLRNGIVDDIQMCAGSFTEAKDTCEGDSGGPLQIYHTNDNIKCMYDIIGVTSFGKACALNPGVYVRVSHYIKWIEDIVWPA